MADQIGFDRHYHYKYLMHADGHTASWGLAKKLRTGSLIVFQESPFAFFFVLADVFPTEEASPFRVFGVFRVR